MPRSPFPATKPSSEGGGVEENRRPAAAKRGYGRDSHDSAEGRSISNANQFAFGCSLFAGGAIEKERVFSKGRLGRWRELC